MISGALALFDKEYRYNYRNTKTVSIGELVVLSVKISPKFQVVIPKEIREALHLLPGQRMQIVQYENRIELIPERDIGELEGFLAGMDTSFTREEDRL